MAGAGLDNRGTGGQRRRPVLQHLDEPSGGVVVADVRLHEEAEAAARCFAEDAVVKDEGHTYRGADAIRRWKAETSAKYTYTVEPFAIVAEGRRTIVTSHLAGDSRVARRTSASASCLPARRSPSWRSFLIPCLNLAGWRQKVR